jgi:hypothetical protein
MPSSGKLNELIGNHQMVQALWSMVNVSSGGLEQVAPLVRRILETGAWEKREVPQLGQIVEFDHFSDFITMPPLRGCGWPLAKVEALIKDDAETLAMWRKAVTPKHGGDRKSEHKQTKSDDIPLDGRGTSRAYLLARLKDEFSAIYDRVIAGEISAYAGAVEAGIRKKPTPLDQILRAYRKLSPEDRAAFLAALQDGRTFQ